MVNKTKAMPFSNDDYEAQDDVRAMSRADEVRSDPKRHKKAKAHAGKMHTEAQSKADRLKLLASGGEGPAIPMEAPVPNKMPMSMPPKKKAKKVAKKVGGPRIGGFGGY